MPAAEDSQASKGPALSHVNLMADSFILNVTLSDLQAIIRDMLNTLPASVAARFHEAARERLVKTNATRIPDRGELLDEPANGSKHRERSAKLEAVLRRTRAVYGSGMGFAGMALLTAVVVGTTGIHWEANSEFEIQLAEVDADISQAIVSAKQELGAGRIENEEEARGTRNALLAALKECETASARGDLDFPYERGLADVKFWELDQSFGG